IGRTGDQPRQNRARAGGAHSPGRSQSPLRNSAPCRRPAVRLCLSPPPCTTDRFRRCPLQNRQEEILDATGSSLRLQQSRRSLSEERGWLAASQFIRRLLSRPTVLRTAGDRPPLSRSSAIY